MKQALLILLAIPFVLASCKERGPVIDFGSATAIDTTYMDAIATPQSRNVLIEEFTGMSCTNCPQGHLLVTSLESQHPGRIVPVALHMYNNLLAAPILNISPADFRTDEATQIDHDVYGGQTALPFAGIDRVPDGGRLDLERALWSDETNTRLATAPPVNIDVVSAYDATSKKAMVTVTAHYTAAVAKKQLLSVMLVEDNLDGPQEYIDSNGIAQTYTSYTHNHILHKMYTPSGGSPVLDSMATKSAGRVYVRTFTIDISGQTWDPANCKVVAFISDNESGDKEVQQAAETPLKQ